MNKGNQKRIEKLRKQIAERTENIRKCRDYQKEIRDNCEKLYKAYLRDEYNRKEYRAALSSYLNEKSAEEWIGYYEQRIAEQNEKIGDLEQRIKGIEESRFNTAAVIAVILLLAFGIGAFLLRPMITGFTAYNATQENITEITNVTENITAPAETPNITENITEALENITAPTAENISEEIIENITTNITEMNVTVPEIEENITENITENISETNITIPEITENITQPTENVTKPEIPENITETNITKNVTEEIGNRAPKLTKEILDITVMIGEKATINLAEYFTDEDNDTITYLAAGAEGISISITANMAEITAEALGEHTISFIASDLKNTTYSNELIVNVTEQRNILPICNVPKQTIVKDSELTINLSNYCSDADNDTISYALLEAQNLTVVQNADNITIKRQQGFAGITTIRLEANDGKEAVEAEMAIEVWKEGVKVTTEDYVQSEAEIGQPVKWQQKVKVENIDNKLQQVEIAIPEDAENITTYKKIGMMQIDIREANVQYGNKEKTLEAYNLEKAEERIRKNMEQQNEQQLITGMAVAETEGRRLGLLERFIDWLISTFRKIGSITGFAVSNANITEPENATAATENISAPKESETPAEQLPQENITTETVAEENITQTTENITENVSEITENITTNITEINVTVPEIEENITENITQNISETNITTPEITENITENITQPTENITETNATTENVTQTTTENISETVTEQIAEETPTLSETTENITQATENITETNITKPMIENITQNITEIENITIPVVQENITAENITEVQNITAEVKTKELLRNITLLVSSSETEEYIIEYVTQAPESIESNASITETTWAKNITISSASAIHYINITAYSNIIESRAEQIHLYWFVNDTKVEVTNDERFALRFENNNNNSLIDRIYWKVPILSNESFGIEVDITILTVQSYPMVGGNWTTEFNTTGTANLTVSAYNGTTYGEESIDNNETYDDLRFLQLKCGEEILNDRVLVITNATCVNGTIENSNVECFGNETVYANYTQLSEANISIPVISAFVENYSCNSTAYYTVYVMTYGKHTQEFTFDGKTAYAYNVAGLPVITLLKPVNNTIVHTGVILNFSITGQNATWYSNNGSANTTFNVSYEINTTGWAEGLRTVTVYANNSEGDWRTKIYTFIFNNSAYGHFEPYYVWPYEDFGNTTVARLKFFTFKAGVRCVGGPCGDLNATLDPEEIQKMIEDIIKKRIELYINEQLKNPNKMIHNKQFKVTVKGIIVEETEEKNEKTVNVSTEII